VVEILNTDVLIFSGRFVRFKCQSLMILFCHFRDGDKPGEEEEVDIDLTDPEVEKAAVKIQAGFKGFKARQEIKDLKVRTISHQVPFI